MSRVISFLLYSLLLLALIYVIFADVKTQTTNSEKLPHHEFINGKLNVSAPIPKNLTFNRGDWSFILTGSQKHISEGKVLGTKAYNEPFRSLFQPVDICIGWGRFQDDTHNIAASVTMEGRSCILTYNLRRGETEPNEEWTNVHIMPVNKNIEAAIREVRVGDTVKLSGLLTNIKVIHKGKQVDWYSTNRVKGDKGSTACEEMLVNHVVIHRKSKNT